MDKLPTSTGERRISEPSTVLYRSCLAVRSDHRIEVLGRKSAEDTEALLRRSFLERKEEGGKPGPKDKVLQTHDDSSYQRWNKKKQNPLFFFGFSKVERFSGAKKNRDFHEISPGWVGPTPNFIHFWWDFKITIIDLLLVSLMSY